jgi:subtilisin family serine protease
VPPAGERRYVPDEVLIEVPDSVSAATIGAIETRFRLTRLDVQPIPLLGSTFYRYRVPNRISVTSAVRALEGDRRIASAQPNYLFALQQQQAAEGTANVPAVKTYDPAQYAVGKMRLVEAHAVAKGDDIRVAVIDSGVDPDQPELAGAIVDRFDTLNTPFTPHMHGTAIAALIAGHSRLMGSAPAARILAVRAFDPTGNAAEATTFSIIRAIDWSVTQRARIINMSFAGPADPGIRRALEAAHKKGVVLIAAAGNAGAKSPPLYPAADPNVIAVTATDADDRLYQGSNRGRHVAVAAPGVDVLIAVPNAGYEVSTGTSFSAAEISGIAALMLQRKGDLTPAAVRDVLLATAKDLGKKGRDDEFGAGIADAYRAVTELPGERVSDAVPPK